MQTAFAEEPRGSQAARCAGAPTDSPVSLGGGGSLLCRHTGPRVRVARGPRINSDRCLEQNWFPGLRREGERRQCRNELYEGVRALASEDEAPLPHHLRRIDAVFAQEELGKLRRTAKAVLGGNPGKGLSLAGAQNLRSRLFQPGLL